MKTKNMAQSTSIVVHLELIDSNIETMTRERLVVFLKFFSVKTVKFL